MSSVTGKGLSQVVGKTVELIAALRNEERQAKMNVRETAFPMESAVRTGEVVP